MAKNDRDLFDRLRQAGIRKQVAKVLSELGEGTSKKALRTARVAVEELRALADEIEGRLTTHKPEKPPVAKAPSRPRTRATASSSRSTPAAKPARAAAKPTRLTATTKPSRAAARTAAGATRTTPRPARPAAGTTATRAPRGQNQTKILESLATGPKTASQIAAETGIGAGTVGSMLSRLSTRGEVVKASRGYALPGVS